MKKEYKIVDILKIIFAILVVLVHTIPNIVVTDKKILQFTSLILRLPVPYFFLASGFFVGLKMKKCSGGVEEDEIINSRAKKSLKLYLIWSLIYLPISIYGLTINNRNIGYDIMSLLRGILIVGENYDSWPLWYLLSMTYSLVFIKYMNKIIKKDKPKYIIVIMTFLLSQLITFLVQEKANLSGIAYYIAKLLSYTLVSGRMFTGIIYIFIGMKISNYESIKIDNKLCMIIIITLGILYSFVNKYIQPFIILGVSIFTFILSINIKNIKINTNNIRLTSIVIYFTHMIFYFIYSVLIHNQGSYYGIPTFLFCIINSFIISVIVCYIKSKKKSKILLMLFG